jgi:Ca-activated chloride channel family protein
MLLGGTALSSIACSVFAQSAPTAAGLTYRSNVTEVRMTFSATDQNNRVIATIEPRDFAVVDDDLVVRNFRSFARSEYTQLDIAVLVDASGSVTRFHQELEGVIQLIAQSDSVPEESFALISFHGLKPTVVCDRNCRDLNTGAQLPAIATGGQTPLYDTVVFASRMLAARSDAHTRKVLILFSDGADTISMSSFSDAIDAALDNSVSVYSIDVNSQPGSRGASVLRTLSTGTGGRFFPLEAGASKVLGAVLEDFHATYTVTYQLPSHAAGFHLVRILPTHNLSLQFHCRRGYYYDSED